MFPLIRPRSEQGMALVTVLFAMMAMLMLGIAAVEFGLGSQHLSRHDQDWNAALGAAEAGIDDYTFRLNENAAYSNYSATNLPPDGNTAFTGYTNVSGGSTISQYRYTVDTSTLASDGTIKITSTGRVNADKRTVYATIRPRGFTDYLYFTDYETIDPASYTGSPFTPAEAQVACAKYYYAGRDSNCTSIQFVSADVINGKLHTNDALLLCGTPTFAGDVTTSWNPGSGQRWRDGCPTSDPNFQNASDPKYAAPLTIPPSNSAIKAETAAGAGGCLYTGPTRIRMLSSGQMTVKSPFSRQTNNACPTNGTGNIPSNGVIFVQSVPSSRGDANYTSGCPYSVSGVAHPLGMPIANDITTYGCRNGDVFIEGTLKGRLTVASDNNIEITGNISYQGGSSGSDLLGLVANNYTEIWHPVSCSSGSSSSCNLQANFPGETARNATFSNPSIVGGILSVNHSFRVQNSAIGAPLGTLTINGAIAQRYRGAVGTVSSGSIVTGLSKAYTYDLRLGYLTPPKFLAAVATAYRIAVWQEIPVPAGM